MDALARVGERLPELLGRQREIDRAALAEPLKGRRVLITGAGGSIGSQLSHTLAAGGCDSLTLLDLHENSLFHLRQQLSARYPRAAVNYVLADVRDQQRIGQMLDEAKPEVVLHLAAYKHVPLGEELPEEFAAVNVLGTWRLLQEARRAGVQKIVYPSTDKAVNPPSVYGATKRSVELMFASFAAAQTDVEPTIVRLVNVVGAWGGVIETFVRQIEAGERLTVTDPDMTRYWITMDDALLLITSGAVTRAHGKVLLLDLGEAVKVTAIAERLWTMLRPDEAGPPMVYLGRRPGERLAEELSYADEELASTGQPGVLRVEGGRPAPDLSTVMDWAGTLDRLVQRRQRAAIRQALFDFAMGLIRA